MNNKLDKFIKDLLPPIVCQYISRNIKRNGYFGNYPDWESAKKASIGYDDDLIVNKVRDALLKVKNGAAVYERDSVLFEEVQYAWPLLAALLWVASVSGNRLNLLDLGGSLGSSYYQNRALLGHLEEFSWSIVEQSNFVSCGREMFQDNVLKFYFSIDDCLHVHNPNVILLSSVLPYLETPYKLLDEIIARQIPYIIVDRTPFIDGGRDRLSLQVVPAEIYEASYPAWILSKDKFIEMFKARYELIVQFDALAGKIDLGNGFANDLGFVYKLKSFVT
jgi:putative methyltransferase (TIGR04325 family)